MRVIIINDSKEYMATLRHMLASCIPSVEVTEFDVTQGDKPNADFDWSLYDLLIIADRLGGTESGLAWLAVLSLSADLPPTLLLSDEKDPFVESKVEELENQGRDHATEYTQCGRTESSRNELAQHGTP